MRGVTPEILSAVTVNDTTKSIIQSGVTLVGTYGNASQALGDFHASDGSIIPSSLNANQAIFNDRAARDLNATIGDQPTILPPTDQNHTLSCSVYAIAVSHATAE